MAHKHHAIKTKTRCFSGPVKQPQNRAAHGGVCYIGICSCGAERYTNANGVHTERGKWETPVALRNFCGGCGAEVDESESGWTHCSCGAPTGGYHCPTCGPCNHR